MPDCALPDHLKGRLHNDWPWPFDKVSRGSNAFGPRCGKGKPGYMAWPPKLVEGYGVARWEDVGAQSIIYIKELANRFVRAGDVYEKAFTAIETSPGHPEFLRTKRISIYWAEIIPLPSGQFWPNNYSPSPLQKFSRTGWMRLDPDFQAYWMVLKQRELPWLLAGAQGEAQEDLVANHRRGARPDPLDVYYNTEGILPVGYTGLRWN